MEDTLNHDYLEPLVTIVLANHGCDFIRLDHEEGEGFLVTLVYFSPYRETWGSSRGKHFAYKVHDHEVGCELELLVALKDELYEQEKKMARVH